MIHRFYLLFFLLVSAKLSGQVVDDFSDGNFTTNPTWTGTSSDFIVNSSQQLQLNNTVAATSYLAIPHNLTGLNNKEWRVWVKQTFSPSSSNFGKVIQTSSLNHSLFFTFNLLNVYFSKL